MRSVADFAGTSTEELIAALRDKRNAIVGTPDMIVEQIAAYAAAGVEELMLQWFDLADVEGLRAFAEQVLPKLRIEN